MVRVQRGLSIVEGLDQVQDSVPMVERRVERGHVIDRTAERIHFYDDVLELV